MDQCIILQRSHHQQREVDTPGTITDQNGIPHYDNTRACIHWVSFQSALTLLLKLMYKCSISFRKSAPYGPSNQK